MGSNKRAKLIALCTLGLVLSACGASTSATSTSKGAHTNPTAPTHVGTTNQSSPGAIVACNDVYGATPSSSTTLPPLTNTVFSPGGTLSRTLPATMAYYVMSGTYGMEAPRGWTCTGTFGADGGMNMKIVGPGSDQIQLTIPNGQGPSVTMACLYFVSAQAVPPCAGSNAFPSTNETINHVSNSEVLIEVPKRGTSTLAITSYPLPVQSVILWKPQNALSGPSAKNDLGYAVEADCALPSSQALACHAALNFVASWYADPAHANF